MADVLEVARELEEASRINTRKDLARWRKRSISRRKFLLTAYLIGAIPVFIAGLVILIAALIVNWDHLTSIGPAFVGVISAFLGAVCCGGPFILIPIWLLLITGLNSYNRVMTQLKKNGRVCEVCEAVSLFDDEYVNPSKRKGHTKDDLVPHMNVIEEDGSVSVLCDKCLAEVNSMDSEK